MNLRPLSMQSLMKSKYPLTLLTLSLISALLWECSFSSDQDCQVLNIYDGDTMTVQCQSSEKIKIRLYCIDSPEMQQAPWGKQARDHLRSITGSQVQLVAVEKDRYGRTVGELYQGSTNLNLQQVQAGQAAVYRQYCKKDQYFQAENQAKNARQGIWSTSGPHQAPWQWRKDNK